MAEAGTLPINGLTATLALDMLDLPSRASLVISGAAGALGGYALQMAVHRGLRAIAIASEADRELLASLALHEFVPRGETSPGVFSTSCPAVRTVRSTPRCCTTS